MKLRVTKNRCVIFNSLTYIYLALLPQHWALYAKVDSIPTFIHLCIYIHTHIHTYIHTYMHIQIYIYTHTNTQFLAIKVLCFVSTNNPKQDMQEDTWTVCLKIQRGQFKDSEHHIHERNQQTSSWAFEKWMIDYLVL